jgi:hypothetical protein
MLRAIALSVVAATIAGAAGAADLPPQTRLGAVFARPAEAPPRDVRESDYPVFVFAPQVDIPPLVNGYYGKPNSYYYRPYYGHAEDTYTRLPYACGFFGYC